jgi:hypothetical protein
MRLEDAPAVEEYSQAKVLTRTETGGNIWDPDLHNNIRLSNENSQQGVRTIVTF